MVGWFFHFFFKPVLCSLATTYVLESNTVIGSVRLQMIINQRKKEREREKEELEKRKKVSYQGPLGMMRWSFLPPLSSFQDYSEYKIHSVEEDENQGSFIAFLKLDSISTPTLLFSFSTVLALLGLLPLHVNFKMSLSIFTK